jgi:hypothetical protein
MPLTSRFEVRLTDAEKVRWGTTAEHDGLSISELVRKLVNQNLTLPPEPEAVVTVPLSEPVTATPPPAPVPTRSYDRLCPVCQRQGRPTCPLFLFLNPVPA